MNDNHKLYIRNRYLLIADISLCVIAYMLAIAFMFSISDFSVNLRSAFVPILVTAAVYIVILTFCSIYRIAWATAGVDEYLRLLFACILSVVVCVVAETFVFSNVFYAKFNIAVNLIIVALICALRFSARILYKIINYSGHEGEIRVLIIGAGQLAVILAREIYENRKLDYKIVGFIDDDKKKRKQIIYGASVLGNRHDIQRICREKRVDEIIFAIEDIDSKNRIDILNICNETQKKVKIISGVEAALTDGSKLEYMREIDINDLLERAPVKLDNELISEDIRDRVILVTGGGGSIGSELCRQILKFKPARLIIVDIYENTTYELQMELEERFPSSQIDVLIASVRDRERLENIFDTYRPYIVFHAAAHKHVPLMEYSPCEAIKNNVFGTYNTALCAEKYGVRKFVMISTDKAVNPTNVMGATKRMCEMIVQTMQTVGETEFVAVRFGNVLGSNGSVIPRFKKQIAAGGPVTVTHPEITRFFMTIPEAAQLVLQAASYAKGGEIFVLDMGSPVKIKDLAEKIIRLSGFVPGRDIKIKFTGLRPGEKLYEELLMDEEGLGKTAHSKIFVGKPIDITSKELSEKLERLKTAAFENQDDDKIKQIISEVIPTYQYKKEQDKLLV